MAEAKRAFITGVTGQDGSYMAQQLLEKGYEVHGLVRRSSTFNRSRIDHLHHDEHLPGKNLHLHYGDVTDAAHANLSRVRPHGVCNLAAQSHVGVFLTSRCIRRQRQASRPSISLKRLGALTHRFGSIRQARVRCSGHLRHHRTKKLRSPRSPYGVAKVYSYWITELP